MQKQQLFLTLIRKTTFFKLKLISSAQKKVWDEFRDIFLIVGILIFHFTSGIVDMTEKPNQENQYKPVQGQNVPPAVQQISDWNGKEAVGTEVARNRPE